MPKVTHLGGRARSGSSHANSPSSEDLLTSRVQSPCREGQTECQSPGGLAGSPGHSYHVRSVWEPGSSALNGKWQPATGLMDRRWYQGPGSLGNFGRGPALTGLIPVSKILTKPSVSLGLGSRGWAAGQDPRSPMQPQLTTQQTTESLPIAAAPLQ